MNQPKVVLIRCHYCSHFYRQEELFLIGDDARMCGKCKEKHDRAIENLVPPMECDECHKKWEDLAAAELTEYVSMFPNWDGGLYKLMCRACNEAYNLKRKDLIGETQFGASLLRL